jgi:hypothetical protein
MEFDSVSKTKIKDILQFRQAIALMDDDFCFTPAFGPVCLRCIVSVDPCKLHILTCVLVLRKDINPCYMRRFIRGEPGLFYT